MAMMNDDIRTFYEKEWPEYFQTEKGQQGAPYGMELDPLTTDPMHVQFLKDHMVKVDHGKVLDVGCGSGRYIEFYQRHFKPALLHGVDFVEAAINTLTSRYPATDTTEVKFTHADFTTPNLDLGERFDLINIAHVLFHIPDDDKYDHALTNLRRHLAPGGMIYTTEILSEFTYRTNMMKVRSRYEFDQRNARIGLRTVAVKATNFFSTLPFATHDPKVQNDLNTCINSINKVIQDATEPTKSNLRQFLAQLERTIVEYFTGKLSPYQFPGGKSVLLKRVED